MLSFITLNNPNPTILGPPAPLSDIDLSPQQHQPSTQSLSPPAPTTTPNNASGSIYSTDPIDVEKATAIEPSNATPNPRTTSPGILPSLSALITPPIFLSSLLDKFLGPRDRKIWGLPRNTFISMILAFLYVFLALILALGIGYMPYRHLPGYNPNTDPTGNGKNIISDNKDTTTLPLPTSGTINTGQATYYNPALGSCGITSTDNDPIVAVSMILYDAASVSPNPNLNPLCGRKVRATR